MLKCAASFVLFQFSSTLIKISFFISPIYNSNGLPFLKRFAMRKKSKFISIDYFSQITFLTTNLNSHIPPEKCFLTISECLHIVTCSLKTREKSVLQVFFIFLKLTLNGFTCICDWMAELHHGCKLISKYSNVLGLQSLGR